MFTVVALAGSGKARYDCFVLRFGRCDHLIKLTLNSVSLFRGRGTSAFIFGEWDLLRASRVVCIIWEQSSLATKAVPHGKVNRTIDSLENSNCKRKVSYLLHREHI